MHSPGFLRPSVCYWLGLVLLPILTALACRFYYHQQAAADKSLFYQNSLDVMYQRQAQNLPADAILFFGDSHIQGLAVTAIAPNAVNFGIGGQQLQRLANHISDYPGLELAGKIVIGIGINDLLHAPDVSIDIAIARLVKALQCCSSKVLLLSVLPVNEATLQKPGLNQSIKALNQQLKTAAQQAGFIYVDSYSSFINQYEQLSSGYDLGDGLHLNPAGYKLLIQNIKSGIKKGSSNEY